MQELLDRLTAVLPAGYQPIICSREHASIDGLQPRFGIGFQARGADPPERRAWLITLTKGDTADMHWQRLGPAVEAALAQGLPPQSTHHQHPTQPAHQRPP